MVLADNHNEHNKKTIPPPPSPTSNITVRGSWATVHKFFMHAEVMSMFRLVGIGIDEIMYDSVTEDTAEEETQLLSECQRKYKQNIMMFTMK